MIYSRIMLPLVKSGLVALGILTLRFAWNDLMWPLIVNTSTEKMTLSAGLSFLQGQYATDYPTMMATDGSSSFVDHVCSVPETVYWRQCDKIKAKRKADMEVRTGNGSFGRCRTKRNAGVCIVCSGLSQ